MGAVSMMNAVILLSEANGLVFEGKVGFYIFVEIVDFSVIKVRWAQLTVELEYYTRLENTISVIFHYKT